MATKNLKKGISIIYDMEKNNYLMQRGLNELDKRIDILAVRKIIREPSCEVIDKKQEGNEFLTIIGFGFAAIGAIIGIFVGWSKGSWFFDSIWYAFLNLLLFGGIAAVVGAAVGFPFGYFVWAKKLQNDENKKYQKAMVVHKAALLAENRRLTYQANVKAALIRQKDELSKKLSDSRAILSGFYEYMGIDEKFRNIISVGYMDEYLRLGIAKAFGGANGLYNLVLKKLDFDKLKDVLGDISYKLDVIISNQDSIYNELIGINKKCDSIVSNTVTLIAKADQTNAALRAVEATTAITAYNTERIAREVEFQNFMEMYIK